MAYTIIRSDGTTLTTIQDGTIDTTSTTLGLPGRNYAGYGQVLDTNFVHLLENFAGTDVPAYPLRGQLWYNTTDGTLRVCPSDGATSATDWVIISTETANGDITTAGNVAAGGDIIANNVTANSLLLGDEITVRLATATENLTASNANITAAEIGTTGTALITTGGTGVPGTMIGVWTVNNQIQIANTSGGTSNARMTVDGVYAKEYYWANGATYNPSGTFTTQDVYTFLHGSAAGYNPAKFDGTISPSSVTTSAIAGGGTISGIWSLTPGSRLTATYADLAERFEADTCYEPGTVVELGGEKEITAVVDELSDRVFGVISDTAAYLMNAGAGDDETHPPVAVSGRVQVKSKGKVKKGDRLVSAGNGFARAAKSGEATAFNTIGRALQDKNSDGEGEVEAIVIIH